MTYHDGKHWMAKGTAGVQEFWSGLHRLAATQPLLTTARVVLVIQAHQCTCNLHQWRAERPRVQVGARWRLRTTDGAQLPASRQQRRVRVCAQLQMMMQLLHAFDVLPAVHCACATLPPCPAELAEQRTAPQLSPSRQHCMETI